MNRKCVAAGTLMALLAIMCSPVSAGITLTDSIDTWGYVAGVPVDAIPIVEGHPLAYTHDLTDSGVPEQYLVTSGTLTLDFTNDVAELDFGIGREFASVAAWNPTTSTWDTFWNVGEVDNDAYALTLQTELITDLNTDGLLGVRISITNNTIGWGTAYLDESLLTVDAVPVPLPASVLLGVFAVGLAGRKLRQFV